MRLKSRFLTALGAMLFVAAVRLLFRTIKLRFEEESPGVNPYDPALRERFLYCVWHDSVVLPLFAGSHHATSALTSKHADGAFVAAVLERLGIEVIRGSTNRMPVAALRGLIDGTGVNHFVITPDGPRGPARVATAGMVYLASRMGLAIVPTAFRCSSCWKIPGSWTHLIIPKPFSTVVLTAGPPLTVLPEIQHGELNSYVQRIQNEMDRLSSLGPGTASPTTVEREPLAA
jgi:lysophospholipid acyltransferase (LPLAT)-like uncharacterized protein